MPEAQPTARPSRGSRLNLFLLTFIVVGLLAVIAYLAGQLNAHRFFLVLQDRALLVHRGAPVPFMTRPFVPINETERIAYAPIAVSPRYDGPKKQSFADRAALDRGIFAIMRAQIETEFYGGRPPTLDRVQSAMQRIGHLAGLGDDDRHSLQQLEGDYAFLQAQAILDGLPAKLREAQRLADQAEQNGTGKLGDPRQLARRLATWTELLSQARSPRSRTDLSSTLLPTDPIEAAAPTPTPGETESATEGATPEAPQVPTPPPAGEGSAPPPPPSDSAGN